MIDYPSTPTSTASLAGNGPKQSHVQESVAQLENHLARGLSALQELHARLQPVLKDVPPETKSSGDVPRPTRVQHAEDLNKLSTVAFQITAGLESILSRLEL